MACSSSKNQEIKIFCGLKYANYCITKHSASISLQYTLYERVCLCQTNNFACTCIQLQPILRQNSLWPCLTSQDGSKTLGYEEKSLEAIGLAKEKLHLTD